MASKYEDIFEIIKHMAEVKMAMNSHKGQIEERDSNDILAMLHGEVKELCEAVEEGNLLHIIEEAADVHNFLVAIVQQATTRYRNRK